MDPADMLNLGGPGIALSHTDPDGAAGAVVHLTKNLLPVAAEVSVVMLRGTEAHTVAATGGVARILDGSQYRTGEGPCLQAAASAATVYAADLRSETRWPRWVRYSADVDARSVLSLGLGIDDEVTGALNVYTTQPDAFPDANGLPQGLAGYAAAALKTIHRYQTQAAQVRHLQAAMMHRAVIEQAKGIIMGDRRCTPDEAFAVLVKLSQDSNRKVRDIAAVLAYRAANTPKPAGGPATTPARRAGAAMTGRRFTGQTPAPITTSTSPGSPLNAAVPSVQITTEVDPCGVAVIDVAGELVMDTADELLAAVTVALGADPITRVVVDLARVSFLDMAALSALLQGRATVLNAGVSFRAMRPQPLVRQVLHRTDTCLLLTAAPPSVGPGLDLPGQGRTPPRTAVA